MKIVKASGETEPFSREKLCDSLAKAGAPPGLLEETCAEVEGGAREGMSTADLYKNAYAFLAKKNIAVAARYSLKNAIMELGPAGFLFEQYIAAVLQEYGYEAATNQILEGTCIGYEVDVLARKDGVLFVIEAKYHNSRGIKSDVHPVLHAFARAEDLGMKPESAWVVTNTKFTTEAIAYAGCKGIRLTGWSHPDAANLRELIEQKGLYPVTVLPSVNRYTRERFAQDRVLFARDLLEISEEKLERRFEVFPEIARSISQEVKALYSFQAADPMHHEKGHSRAL